MGAGAGTGWVVAEALARALARSRASSWEVLGMVRLMERRFCYTILRTCSGVIGLGGSVPRLERRGGVDGVSAILRTGQLISKFVQEAGMRREKSGSTVSLSVV